MYYIFPFLPKIPYLCLRIEIHQLKTTYIHPSFKPCLMKKTYSIMILDMSTHCCKICVMDVLNVMQIKFVSVELGVVVLYEALTEAQWDDLNTRLSAIHLRLQKGSDGLSVLKIKNCIHQWQDMECTDDRLCLSKYLAQQLFSTDDTISRYLFKCEQPSPTQYCIVYKKEKAIILLTETSYSYGEIAYILHYKSDGQFFTQFKHSSGITPKQCRNGMAVQN